MMNTCSSRIRSLYAILVHMIVNTLSSEITNTKWDSDLDFANNLDTATVIWKRNNISLVNCGILCNQNPSCWSFFYHSNMRMCLASMSFKRGLPPDEEIQQGWKYYTRPRQCDGGYVYHQPLGLCFKIHREPKNFSDSMADCESEGAKLLIVEDVYDFQYIQQVLLGVAVTVGSGPFIGLRAIGPAREWTWWNGQAVSYIVWAAGQPDNYLNEEKCGHLTFFNEFKYNDIPCASQMSYICQRTVEYLCVFSVDADPTMLTDCFGVGYFNGTVSFHFKSDATTTEYVVRSKTENNHVVKQKTTCVIQPRSTAENNMSDTTT